MSDNTNGGALRVALIDFGNLFAVRYHANGDDAATARNEVLGYVRNMTHSHDVVAICCDRPPYKRKERFPGYKEGRTPWPAGARELRTMTENECAEIVHRFCSDGHEADDVIATVDATLQEWAAPGHDAGPIPMEIHVYSDDKDLCQLATRPAVTTPTVVHRLNGKPRDTAEEYGIAPGQIPDYLALVGDSSDSLPGVKGVGPKRAAKMLDRFGDLEGLSGAVFADDAGETFGASVLESLRQAFDAPPGETPMDVRGLIRLDCDVPIDNIADATKRTTPAPIDGDDDGPGESFEDSDPNGPPAPTCVADVVGPGEGPDLDEPIPYRPTPPPSRPKSSRGTPIAAEAPDRGAALVRRAATADAVPWERRLEPDDLRAAAKLARWAHESQWFKIRSPSKP